MTLWQSNRLNRCARLGVAILLAGAVTALSARGASGAEPTVLDGAELPGRQARCGADGPRGVIVTEGGLTLPLALPPGRVTVEAELRSNGAGGALRQRTVGMAIGGGSASATTEALDRGLRLRVELVQRTPTAAAILDMAGSHSVEAAPSPLLRSG